MVMQPCIAAQEQLQAIEAAALGGGHVKKSDERRAIARLERAASGGRRSVRKPTPQMLSGMGIAVVNVPSPHPEARSPDKGAHDG